VFLVLTTLPFSAQEKTKRLEKEIIVVYGSDTCHYCIETKLMLKEKNIKFTYYDIDKNKVKEQEMLVVLQKVNIPIATLSLPVIDFKGDVFLNEGDFEKFLEVLKKKIE
jgi:glutaredoxin